MSTPTDPTAFNRLKQSVLSDVDVDGLGQAVLTLCHELWVVKDRMAVLEAVLEKHGIDAASEIEIFQPDEALMTRLNSDGRALTSRVLGALNDD